MRLRRDEVPELRVLDELDEGAVRAHPAEDEAVLLQSLVIRRVDLVPVSVPFADGVYQLGQLAVHEGFPERFKHMPSPLVAVSSSSPELAGIFDEVRAVLIRRDLSIDWKARAVLMANFTLGLTFNGHEVWVRRPVH